jgi:predicted nucleic acid-binding protein
MNGEIRESIVFDTNTVLGFLERFNNFINLQDHFPDCDLFVSEITEIELLGFPGITEDEINDIKRFLFDCVIIPLTEEIKEITIDFRRATACKTPDSIIAATAIALDAALVTNDHRLLSKQFAGFRTVSIIE